MVRVKVRVRVRVRVKVRVRVRVRVKVRVRVRGSPAPCSITPYMRSCVNDGSGDTMEIRLPWKLYVATEFSDIDTTLLEEERALAGCRPLRGI